MCHNISPGFRVVAEPCETPVLYRSNIGSREGIVQVGSGGRYSPGARPDLTLHSLSVARALKTKHDTPKYGLIYHASLVGQSGPKHKGKISRTLAAKTSLCVRVDALGEEPNSQIGLDSRVKVEQKIQQCEQDKVRCGQ